MRNNEQLQHEHVVSRTSRTLSRTFALSQSQSLSLSPAVIEPQFDGNPPPFALVCVEQLRGQLFKKSALAWSCFSCVRDANARAS